MIYQKIINNDIFIARNKKRVPQKNNIFATINLQQCVQYSTGGILLKATKIFNFGRMLTSEFYVS